jgi:hypothetical protein
LIKRRALLLGSLAGACVVAGLRFAFSSETASIAAILHKRLDYLKLDEAGVRRFAADLASLHAISSSRLRMISALGPVYARSDLMQHTFLSTGIHHGEERVVTSYLLSSDFFSNGSDESKTVNYLGLYDPLRACGNPFARRIA